MRHPFFQYLKKKTTHINLSPYALIVFCFTTCISLVTFAQVPEENRFTKVVLGDKLDEPMEMTLLKDGRVLFVERFSSGT